MLTHEEITLRIPHHSSMSLLDRVKSWTETTIDCAAISHHFPDNPLRSNDELAAVCGIEYAAQAIAIHGSLISGKAQVEGYLVSTRGVKLFSARLDDVTGDLQIHAAMLLCDESTSIYEFRLEADNRTLLSGQATIMVRKTG